MDYSVSGGVSVGARGGEGWTWGVLGVEKCTQYEFTGGAVGAVCLGGLWAESGRGRRGARMTVVAF